MVKVGETIRPKCKFLTWQNDWKMTWYVNDKVIRIKKEKRFRQRNGRSSILRIRKVRKEDAGMYRCVARNKFGSVSKQLNLTVIGKLLKLYSNLSLNIFVWSVRLLLHQPGNKETRANFVETAQILLVGIFACSFSADGGHQLVFKEIINNNGASVYYAMS